ncbi:MAG: hypothetical protein HQK62_07995 [Desulfamplus sp.]|nr:hypothetical protein [Desulfamplus sp.]
MPHIVFQIITLVEMPSETSDKGFVPPKDFSGSLYISNFFNIDLLNVGI